MTSYVAAWYVSSVAQWEALRARGFNAAIISSTCPNLDAILDALIPGELGVIGAGDCGVNPDWTATAALLTRLHDHPFLKGVLSFDEVNLTGITLATQREWYVQIKAINPAWFVLVSHYAYGPGVPNSQFVDPVPGTAYDVPLVDVYPLHYGDGGDFAAGQAFVSALIAVDACFNPKTPVVPIMQAAWSSVETTGALRAITNDQLMQQYAAWRDIVGLDMSKAICFYGAGETTPEDVRCGTNTELFDGVTAVVARHHQLYGGTT